MKISLKHVGLVGLSGLHSATGHYGYPYSEVDGVVSKRWEYIRPTTHFGPDFNFGGPDQMCGRNATLPSALVKTLKIAAGSVIGFRSKGQSNTNNGAENLDLSDYNPNFSMYHSGPATAYMSRFEGDGDLNEYAGDGDWFKIGAVGASDGLTWDYSSQKRIKTMNFTIPATTPPGKYLLRAEHLNMDNGAYYQSTEQYVNCMHIEVTGPGGGTPGPLVKYPGAKDSKDPGVWLPALLFRPDKPMEELKTWQGAGPAVWRG